MKFNKNKGWVFEELEKKNECLDADCFGGENPEDVEKEREKKDKEINKRFEGTRKNAEKTVGPDFEEKAKPHKVEEQFKNRKDLAEAIKQFNDNHIEFKVRRSTQEGYRYVVEYFTTEHTKPEEVLFEKFDLDEDFVDEVLPDAIPEEPIVVSTEPEEVIAVEEPTDEVKENGIYMSLSSELRDTLSDIENLKSLVVTLADNEDSDIINELNSIIDDRTIHVGMLQALMEKFDTKVEAEEVPSEEEVIIDEVPEEETKEESLKEGHLGKSYKGYTFDWNEDELDSVLDDPNRRPTITILDIDGKEVKDAGAFSSYADARKWVDAHPINVSEQVAKIFATGLREINSSLVLDDVTTFDDHTSLDFVHDTTDNGGDIQYVTLDFNKDGSIICLRDELVSDEDSETKETKYSSLEDFFADDLNWVARYLKATNKDFVNSVLNKVSKYFFKESLNESNKKYALVVNGEWYSTHNSYEKADKARQRMLDACSDEDDAKSYYGKCPNIEIKEIDESLNESMKSEVTKWWNDVEDANIAMQWGFKINNEGCNEEEMHAAMFDMLDELKEKGAFELFKQGKKIYNKYAKYSKYNDGGLLTPYDKEESLEELKEAKRDDTLIYEVDSNFIERCIEINNAEHEETMSEMIGTYKDGCYIYFDAFDNKDGGYCQYVLYGKDGNELGFTDPLNEDEVIDEFELDDNHKLIVKEKASNSLKESKEVARVEYCVMDKLNNNIECFDNTDDAIAFAKDNEGVRVLEVQYGPKDEHGDEPELSAEEVWSIRESLEEEKEIDDNPEHGYASIEDYERSQEILDAMMNLRKEEEAEGTALLRAWAIDKTMSDEEFHEKNEKLTKETQEKIEALYNELKGLTDRAKK